MQYVKLVAELEMKMALWRGVSIVGNEGLLRLDERRAEANVAELRTEFP